MTVPLILMNWSAFQEDLWSCPYEIGQLVVDGDCSAMNSRGERMRKPLWEWMVFSPRLAWAARIS